MTTANLRDPACFSDAYRAHSPAMLSAANRVLRDPAAAEDVVQDVFMQLWRRPEAYDLRRSSLSSYLKMMAHSRALDRWRTRSARAAAVERSAAERRIESPIAEDALEPVILREDRRRVVGAVERLPDDQRQAVLLAFGKGLSAREIATAADVPLGTAKSRVRLGLQKARSELAAAA